MVKSVWQMTGCEHQLVPGPLCVQPELLSLLGCEPLEAQCAPEGSCVAHSLHCGYGCGTVGPDCVAPLSSQPQPLPSLRPCVTVSRGPPWPKLKPLSSGLLWKLEFSDLRKLLPISLQGQFSFWPTRVSTGIHTHTHTHTDI